MRGWLRARAFPIGFALAIVALAIAPRTARADDVDVNGSAPTEEEGFSRSDEAKSDEAKPDEAKADEAKPDEPKEESTAWADYRKSVRNRYLMGLNSLITFPADPVMSAVKPDAQFNKLPLADETKYPVGFLQGTLLSMYRAGMGALDVLFAPITPMKMLSPEPRYMIFSDVKHEEY